jgi:hypothetical protein
MKKVWINIILGLFSIQFYDDGVGRFDSVGGDYDEQTSFAFFQQMYYQKRAKSLFDNLSNSVSGSFEASGTVNGSIIDRTKITEGDKVVFTLQDHINGKASYGDKPVMSGGFLAFKNAEARVNNIDSPAIQIVGRMSQQRVRQSIKNLPMATRQSVINWCAEQTEFEAIPAFLQGASPSVMNGTSDGGLGISLGIGSGAGAGVPLMNKHWYTPDTGIITYSTTPATHNAAVDAAIYGIDSSSNDQFTLAKHTYLRSYMEDILFEPTTFLGMQLKAIALTDPAIMWRLAKSLLADVNKYQMPRGKENPFWTSKDIIVMDEVAYISCPALKKYRPSSTDGTSATGPAFGPLTADVDPRTYSTSSTNGLIIYCGGGALKEGYNEEVEVTEEHGRHGGTNSIKGMDVAAHFMLGYVRGEFYAKDGRAATADNVENRSIICAAFNEPGVGLDDSAE